MAKAQQSQATGQATDLSKSSKQQTQTSLSGGGPFGGQGLSQNYGDALGRGGAAFTGAQQGFTQAQSTGGYDPGMLQTIRQNAAGLATSGGYDPETLAKMQTGGFDPNTLQKLRGQYDEFVQTGGYDPAALQTYRNFATTGDFTPQQKSQFMAQATGGVGQTYKTLMAQDQARRAATGGLGGDATAQMARNLAQGQAQATIGGETSLHDIISANKLAGAGGLGQIATARESALTGERGLETDVAAGTRGMAADVASGRRAGAQQLADIEAGVARGSLTADQGLAQLYNSATGEINDAGRLILGVMGIDADNQKAAINALVNLSKNPGAFDDVLRIASLVTLHGDPAGGKSSGGSSTGIDTGSMSPSE